MENQHNTGLPQSPQQQDIWGWLSTAQKSAKDFAGKAQEMAESAGKVASVKALELAKHADEMRQNYDLELATSILMGTVGGPIDTTAATGGSNDNRRRNTKKSMKELDLVYVTENIISMAFPSDFSKPDGIQAGNDIDVVAEFLKKRHTGHFMIWNVSEESYDYSKFGDQVLEYKFPGHPAPPLGLLFKICTSVESWLDADERNVAVVHCLTGKGRTAALIACILAWIGEFTSPVESLQYIAERRSISVDYLTIPSQRRYIQYFSNMLDGVKPRSEPLLLRRIIINSIPTFGSDSDDGGHQGCCPYIQLFKNGKLIATAAPQGESNTEDTESGSAVTDALQLRWIKSTDGSCSFAIDCPIQGDILLRCRHAARSGVRVSMFRCGFHTGYSPSGVMRLTKAQLDGSSADPRFNDDFFVDFIFAPILTASNIPLEAINTSASVPSAAPVSASPPFPTAGSESSIKTDKSKASSVTDSGLVIDATSTDKYEQSLHKDAKFWENISTRKQRAKKRRSRKFLSNQQEQFSILDDAKLPGEPNSNHTEVNFLPSLLSAGDTAGGSSGAAPTSGGGVSGLSDMELIMQLSELENEEKQDSATPGSSSSGMGSGSTIASSVTETGTDSDDFAIVSKSKDKKNESTTSAEQSSEQEPVSSELQVLEDLEKELGLDLFSTSDGNAARGSDTGTTTATRPTTTSAKTTIEGDDNLDELEKYLQSLSAAPN